VSDFANLIDCVNDSKPAAVENAFAWGSDEIGQVIGRNPRQTHHLLMKGEIKSAKKVGGRWVANIRALLREFGAAN
jgi:hypothetical protein